jgi:hypothetical protein
MNSNAVTDALQIDAWSVALQSALATLSAQVVGIIPKLVIALIIIIAGWAVAALIGQAVARVIKLAKIDNVLTTAGVDGILKKAGLNLNAGKFVGTLVKWFVIAVFLIAAFDVLGLSQVNDFLDKVIGFLPQLIVAVLILLVGIVLAESLQKVIIHSVKAAGAGTAHLLGGIARWGVLVFAFLIALDTVNITQDLSGILFTGFVGMFALAGGLAFGLGGRDAAKEYIEKMRGDFRNPQQK